MRTCVKIFNKADGLEPPLPVQTVLYSQGSESSKSDEANSTTGLRRNMALAIHNSVFYQFSLHPQGSHSSMRKRMPRLVNSCHGREPDMYNSLLFIMYSYTSPAVLCSMRLSFFRYCKSRPMLKSQSSLHTSASSQTLGQVSQLQSKDRALRSEL
ncbi:hypothetical protein VTL71DRAFT_12366 [Oculimacula yallundae]|uniref:Uncharacterized protein n=1 Tax=Oculimacula yallundae TaxID=86028 RepID=A0ABR4CPI8_9HELO